ncbi:Guanylate kinase [compost metagenome]
MDEVGAKKIKQFFNDKILIIGIKAERHECAHRLEIRGHSSSDINLRLESFEAEIDALSHCDLVLNNTDENRGKIDQIVRFLKEGLEKQHGSL